MIKIQNSLEFIDSARHFVPLQKKFYTWWSYRNIDWQKSNRGRRLDHIWVTPVLKSNLKQIEALVHVRNWPLPSDHVPLMLTLIWIYLIWSVSMFTGLFAWLNALIVISIRTYLPCKIILYGSKVICKSWIFIVKQ